MQEGSVSFNKKAGTEIKEGLMGYWTSLHLIDVKIKTESILIVKKSLKTRKGRKSTSFQFFFERAMLDREGFLTFKASEDDIDPYAPDEEEGDVPALYGKWYEDERIAAWIGTGKGNRDRLASGVDGGRPGAGGLWDKLLF
jgi:hypothetical protein